MYVLLATVSTVLSMSACVLLSSINDHGWFSCGMLKKLNLGMLLLQL